MKNKFLLIAIVLLMAANVVFAQAFEKDYANLVELVYNDGTSTLEQVKGAYNTAISSAKDNVEKAKAHYMYGFYLLNSMKMRKEAGDEFFKAMDLAKEVFDKTPTWQSYLIWAQSLSQNCTAQNHSYMIGNGLDVPKYAKKAIELKENCGAAKYLVACTDIYAPKPFDNVKKGREYILSYYQKDEMTKVDTFSAYITLGHIEYMAQNYDKANPYFEKAKALFPNNKLVASYLNKTYKPLNFDEK